MIIVASNKDPKLLYNPDTYAFRTIKEERNEIH